MKIAVIIPAAGASTRFGADQNKLDADLAGRPVLQRTVELFVKLESIAEIIVAGPHDDNAYNAFRQRHADKLGLLGCKLCPGGAAHRYETVKAALAHVSNDATHIMVHDAARPCAPVALIERLIEAGRSRQAVIPAVDVTDTIKRVADDEAAAVDIDPLDAILGSAGKANITVRTVEKTIQRERLVLVQTPQLFEADLLHKAYAQSDLASTDDAGLVERLGEVVHVIEGDVRNIKITHASDLPLAQRILGIKGPRDRPSHLKF